LDVNHAQEPRQISARGVGRLELANFVDRKMCNRTTEWE